MDDTLKPWDFCKGFTINEAASLMLGLRPDMTTSSGGSLTPVIERMTEDHRRAKMEVSMRVYRVECGKDSDLSPVADDLLLCDKCVEAMDDLKANKKDREDMEGLYVSSKDIQRVDSELAKFSRGRLAAWIRANGLPSKYEFSDQTERNKADTAQSPRWPWGSHHTKMLGHLEAAANEFWVGYDKDKPRTAPKNDEVISWLKERNVTGNMANSIATMLRADGLATGPRKKVI